MSSTELTSIRPASLDDAAALQPLTWCSALSWGYEPEFLAWEPEAIAVTPELLAHSTTCVLVEAGRMLGYNSLVGEPAAMSLDKLFVEPDRIGTGCGKRLWLHAVATAVSLGASELTIASDPNAAPFYRAMGAIWTGEEPTTREGWSLQMFLYRLLDPRAHLCSRFSVLVISADRPASAHHGLRFRKPL